MTFSSGNTSMDELIDSIADGLIATGAWADADPAGRPALAAPARRAVQHITDGLFVSLERVVTSPGAAGYIHFNEVRVDLSSGYDTGTSAPTGTVQTSGIPCEAWQSYGTSFIYNTYWATGTGSGNKAGQFWMWLDDDGFTVMSSWLAGSGYDYTSFLSVERNTTKEYPDGYTNFFLTAWTNNDHTVAYATNQYTSGTYYAAYFNNRTGGNPIYGDLARLEYGRPFNVGTVTRDDGVEVFEAAYRSDGNSKVYFHFPHFSNNLDTAKRTPIAQTKRWFVVALSQGLADGDLVDWVDGAVTKTYLVKTLQSPDSTAYMAVAVRQG